MTLKYCSTCKKTKDITDFHINSKAKDKHISVCKKCRHNYVKKEGRGYKTYREYQTPYQLYYYYLHKDEDWYKERIARYRKEFKERHPGYFREQARKYYRQRVLKDPNFLKKQYQRRLELHPDYNKIKSFKRKIKK